MLSIILYTVSALFQKPFLIESQYRHHWNCAYDWIFDHWWDWVIKDLQELPHNFIMRKSCRVNYNILNLIIRLSMISSIPLTTYVLASRLVNFDCVLYHSVVICNGSSDFVLWWRWEWTENMSEILNYDPTNSMRSFHSPNQRYSKRGFFIIIKEVSISCEM